MGGALLSRGKKKVGNVPPQDLTAGVSQTRGADRTVPVLVYDGECSVCRGAVEWIRARSAPGAFEFLSFHSSDMERRFPFLDREACRKEVHLVLPGGKVLAGERVAPEIFSRIPGYGWIATLLRLPGARFFSGVFYRWFARRRHAVAYLFSPGHEDS